MDFIKTIDIISKEDYDILLKKYDYILENIKNIIIKSKEPNPEGNCFFYDKTFNRLDEFYDKQRNLYSISKYCNNIMEIGFNAGHSTFLFLISNPNSNIIVFDILEHSYTLECFNYLNNEFGNRITLIAGDSNISVGTYIRNHPDKKFDMIHIDGNHEYCKANLDFFISKDLSIKNKTILIWDDLNVLHLESLWIGYIKDKHIIDIHDINPNILNIIYHGIGIYI